MIWFRSGTCSPGSDDPSPDIGYNSAGAMEFKDEAAATATLSALTAKEDIVTAVLYKPDGKILRTIPAET